MYQIRTEHIEFVIQSDEPAHQFVLHLAVHQFIVLSLPEFCFLTGSSRVASLISTFVLSAWMDDSRNKLRQFEKYVCNVFGLPDLFASLVDTRRAPKIRLSMWSTACFTPRCCASPASMRWK